MTSPAYSYFKFAYLVEWGHPETNETVKAGFQEVTLGSDITVSGYREGGNNCIPMKKVTGVHKSTNITLKRGLMVASDLFNWIENVRLGSEQARRNVTITMRDEVGQVVKKWNLTSLLLVKYTGPALNTKGEEIAIEELVLSGERADFETSEITQLACVFRPDYHLNILHDMS